MLYSSFNRTSQRCHEFKNLNHESNLQLNKWGLRVHNSKKSDGFENWTMQLFWQAKNQHYWRKTLQKFWRALALEGILLILPYNFFLDITSLVFFQISQEQTKLKFWTFKLYFPNYIKYYSCAKSVKKF